MPATILFVEDNDELRQNAEMVLDLEGYTVQVARDGQEALDMLDEGFRPDLIVSDIMMPRLDGYAFFEAVRQQRHLRAIPFIFMTARGSRKDISAGRQLGADDYLTKPFDPSEFLIAVQSRLQRTADIRDEANESLNDARRKLVELLSHELKTPLTYVTGGFALLAEELKRQAEKVTNQDVLVSLDLIQNGTKRLNRLAEQMVLYSQILSGMPEQQIQTRGEPHELLFLVSDAISLLTPLAHACQITFEQSFPAESLVVFGIHRMLLAAFSEIIRNAIQYSTPHAAVRLVMERDDNWAVITVTDQGHGIAARDQASIWEVMIQSARDQQEQQGAGMGLPIAKGIIEAHKGSIGLVSKLGQGTQVTIRLPLYTPD
ncbi:MAG: response regulator [Anaerolineae bacterium]|nr:response regulator [Anaerolineae bacterium]